VHYTIVQGSQGWLIVYYTKDKKGKRVVFEVSDWYPPTTDRQVMVDAASARLKALVLAANNVGGHFP